MAVSDTLPNTLVVYNRDEWVKYRLQRYGNRLAVNNPSADISQATAPGSDAWLDSMATADCLAVMSANAQTIAGTALIANMTEAQLIAKGDALGVPWPEATGAAGYVIAQTSSNGGEIRAGDICTNQLTRFRYECLVTATYITGDPVPVRGVDTGPNSNADPGTQLTWESTRAGVFAAALVQEQPDGTGLSGGRDRATIEEYRALLKFAQANESASGNEAAIIRWAQDSLHHGVSVQKCFVYPGIGGPGVTAYVITLAPATVGGSRIPNGTQVSQVFAYVKSQLPGDDGIIPCVINAADLVLVGRVDWSDAANGWQDATPWPNYIVSDRWLVSAATDATHFTVATQSGVYTTAQQPSIGKAFAVFDSAHGKFFRKVIKSFTGAGPWAITCDTDSGASDTTFTPVAGSTLVSPWSDSLQQVATTLSAYVDKMGPSEQALGLGDGRRKLRSPKPTPKEWPITITSRIESDVTDLTSVDSFQLVDGMSQTVPMGASMTYSNLFTNPRIAIYSL